MKKALCCLALVLAAPRSSVAAAAAQERSVILVTTDGLRWQEVFSGAEQARLAKDEALRREFWRETPEERRKALMPFLWGVIAERGQVWGNARRGSAVKVTNGKNFSYPGYNELLAGFPDPRIDSNDKVPNPNVTVLEWLNGRPAFKGRVAAFGTWDVLAWIINRERSGLTIVAGEEAIKGEPLTERQAAINDLRRDTPLFGSGNTFDSFTHHAALEHLKRRRPRVLYVLYGETDEWAHEGRYDGYLRAARRFDGFLRQLWETAQSLPQYRGKVSLLVATDHGRGDGARWTDHGDVPGAADIWLAALGPGIAPRGERADAPQATQAQLAATVAALAGEDYGRAQPKAAPPLDLR